MRPDSLRSAATALVVVSAWAAATGCIPRYRAPDDPVVPATPYSALALYRAIVPPLRTDGTPLPRAALRLAWDGRGVFADAALIDGPEHPAVTETWAGALALLQIRPSDPVVAIVEEGGIPAVCEQLGPMADRLRLAVRRDDTPLHPMVARPDPGLASADPLDGVPLVCPAPAPAAGPAPPP